ncbi:MAG: prepilin-type N-terminal cleavage/methylation domain-containing protein [Candidatus Omnitrophota bacterium]
MKKGFTFIELLISLSVIAIAFVPLMQMFTNAIEQTYNIAELNTARYLGKEGMEKLKNLNFTKAQIKDLGDVWEPPLDKPALEYNERKWRILRKVDKNSNPLEVRILVFQDPIIVESKPILELVTLIEDLEWTEEG